MFNCGTSPDIFREEFGELPQKIKYGRYLPTHETYNLYECNRTTSTTEYVYRGGANGAITGNFLFK
jgi:hypothetical protein